MLYQLSYVGGPGADSSAACFVGLAVGEADERDGPCTRASHSRIHMTPVSRHPTRNPEKAAARETTSRAGAPMRSEPRRSAGASAVPVTELMRSCTSESARLLHADVDELAPSGNTLLMRLAGALLALAAGVALVATGAAGASTTRAAAVPPKEIKLISVTTKANDTDKPPKGASKGDRTIGASALYNGIDQFGRKAGARVGTDRSIFTLRDAKTLYANGTATLPGGTLHFQGTAKVKKGVFHIPVVSGTGDFTGAKGSLLIPIVEPGTKVVANLYRLTYRAAA